MSCRDTGSLHHCREGIAAIGVVDRVRRAVHVTVLYPELVELYGIYCMYCRYGMEPTMYKYSTLWSVFALSM